MLCKKYKKLTLCMYKSGVLCLKYIKNVFMVSVFWVFLCFVVFLKKKEGSVPQQSPLL